MDFDFLPKLPKSDLDDRTFQELVDECLLRIPRYCPEWTNYNPSDPGVTLIELFSWLTDQMLLRFNQVPRRNYVAFLEVLGIRLQPPAPARTAVTFYLSASLPAVYQIQAGVEVATERTETEEAIIFSTDRTLTIGLPEIRHLLTAEVAESIPTVLRDRFANRWTRQSSGRWEGREEIIFSDRPRPGNCFYVVFDPDQPIAGNVIALTLAGETATATGINPNYPPRRWEAWNGQDWVPVLLQEGDDQTRGFSFHEIGDGTAEVQAADVVMHLPQNFPVTHFATYQGYWIRCVCTEPVGVQSGYSSSPLLISADVRSIGGTIYASQCARIENETLGESDGLPGQRFQFQSAPILPCHDEEYLRVIPPDGVPQRWQEVEDFADSTAESRHYVLDSLSGTIQFGPLVREPGQAREVTMLRSRLQTQGQSLLQGQAETITSLMERQYGAVPPKGSTLQMVAYRTGGGRKGNVQPHTLRIVKSAVPYVAAVTNHTPARNGADAESLDDAVLRVPKLLRTRDRAVTPEDFEVLARQAGRGAIARSLCPTAGDEPGQVSVIVVPQTNTDSIERGLGIHPTQFELSPQLRQQVIDYLNERRLLGVQVNIKTPSYVGVSVQTEVGIEPQYNTPQAQQAILQQLDVALYRFLNPLTGGRDGMGWPFGTPVYPSDIISLIQGMPGVRYLGTVLLFELRLKEGEWVRFPAPENQVVPGPQGLICSWHDRQLRSAHTISLVT
ncbi:MAG: putative baseplate assembly protein [Cyanobacteria bacterium J06639_16]